MRRRSGDALGNKFGDALGDILGDVLGPTPFDRLGLAVSGGSDSMALLHLAARWAAGTRTGLHVVTVDHGLRPEAAEEAAFVAAQSRALGLSHDTLAWRGWDGGGNLQSTARGARRDLIAGWAEARGIALVATGHTLDDQAETVLLRMARGSGVDGLSGMAAAVPGRVTWLRPLLGFRRADLRDWLVEGRLEWCNDPSNDDPRFDRVRARAMMRHLAGLGLGPERLADLAGHMARARDCLTGETAALARRIVTQQAGDLLVDRAGMAAAHPELVHRLLAAAVMWIAGSVYRPRFDALAAFGRDPARATLGGCRARTESGRLRVGREYRILRDESAPTGAVWDGRWRLEGPDAPGLHAAALGPAGLRLCPQWRATGLPAATLHASPAVWAGESLVAAPLAGLANGWRAFLAEGRDDFTSFLLSH